MYITLYLDNLYRHQSMTNNYILLPEEMDWVVNTLGDHTLITCTTSTLTL